MTTPREKKRQKPLGPILLKLAWRQFLFAVPFALRHYHAPDD